MIIERIDYGIHGNWKKKRGNKDDNIHKFRSTKKILNGHTDKLSYREDVQFSLQIKKKNKNMQNSMKITKTK